MIIKEHPSNMVDQIVVYPKEFRRILTHHIPQLNTYDIDKQREAASFIWDILENPWNRRHRTDKNGLSFSCGYLQDRFGDDYYQGIRDLLLYQRQEYRPSHNDSKEGKREGLTRSYGIRDEVWDAIHDYQDMVLDNPEAVKLLDQNGKKPRFGGNRKGILSRDINGSNAMLGIDGPRRIAGNMELLRDGFLYIRESVRYKQGKRTDPPDGRSDVMDILSNSDSNASILDQPTGKLTYWMHIAFKLLVYGMDESCGYGRIPLFGRETTSGRIVYTKVISLQTIPKQIRNLFLYNKGYWDYDIDTAYVSFYANFLKYHIRGKDPFEEKVHYFPSLGFYKHHKDWMRELIAKQADCTKAQAKGVCLRALLGSPLNSYYKCSIPQFLDNDPELVENLIHNDFVNKIKRMKEDVLDDMILDTLEKNGRGTHLKNTVGKPIEKYYIDDDGNRQEIGKNKKLSHVLQGYEAAFLKTVYDLYPNQVLLYMHDGIVTDDKIDTQNVVDEYRERTGFDISLEGKELSTKL